MQLQEEMTLLSSSLDRPDMQDKGRLTSDTSLYLIDLDNYFKMLNRYGIRIIVSEVTPPLVKAGVYSMDRLVQDGGPLLHATPSGPYFDPEVPSNVSVISDGLAVLNCRVYNIGNRTVSWIRLSDLKLLTVGRYTYTSDLRFEGLHQKFSPDWKLVLNGADVKDSGTYECQVSTSPHISRVISLTVKTPVTRVLGGPEIFLDTSSAIVNLTCIIESLEPPQSVAWYHNNTKVSAYQSGVSLVVDKAEVTTVSLLLQTVTTTHSGLWECRPDTGPSASVRVHVIKGDKTAQLSRGDLTTTTSLSLSFLLILPHLLSSLSILQGRLL